MNYKLIIWKIEIRCHACYKCGNCKQIILKSHKLTTKNKKKVKWIIIFCSWTWRRKKFDNGRLCGLVLSRQNYLQKTHSNNFVKKCKLKNCHLDKRNGWSLHICFLINLRDGQSHPNNYMCWEPMAEISSKFCWRLEILFYTVWCHACYKCGFCIRILLKSRKNGDKKIIESNFFPL